MTVPADEGSRLAARQPALIARAAVMRAVRAYFEGQGFLEVETPARVRSPGQELHLDAIAASDDRYLITSPEYHMKRLVGAGYQRIVQICRCYRAHEDGPHHQPEFTMIEWYRAGGSMDELMRDCEALLEVAARAAGTWGPLSQVPARHEARSTIALQAPFARSSVRELVRRHAGIDLRGDESPAELREMARSAGCQVGPEAAWDDAFFQIFLDKVEPALSLADRPTFVYDWPLPLAALARQKPGDPLTAERFELYAAGLELANAFGELTDADEQRQRFEQELALRAQRGKPVYPIDERLLQALTRMPPTCGIAMGFDRLLMLVTGAPSIRDTLAFAYDEA